MALKTARGTRVSGTPEPAQVTRNIGAVWRSFPIARQDQESLVEMTEFQLERQAKELEKKYSDTPLGRLELALHYPSGLQAAALLGAVAGMTGLAGFAALGLEFAKAIELAGTSATVTASGTETLLVTGVLASLPFAMAFGALAAAGVYAAVATLADAFDGKPMAPLGESFSLRESMRAIKREYKEIRRERERRKCILKPNA